MAYQRYEPGEYRPQFGRFSFFPPVIKYLIIINLAVYLFERTVLQGMLSFGGRSLQELFFYGFYLLPIGDGFMPWQLVTYMFVHGNFWHLFMNMLMLWMFGMEVENTWGTKKFLLFFLICGVAGGLSNLLIAPLFAPPAATIGASGGVYGVLVAFAMLFPNRYVYFYFFIPVKAKYLITGLIAFEVFYGTTGTSDGVAHMAHLGGAVLAAIWVVLESRGTIDRLLGRAMPRRSQSDRSGPVLQTRVRDARIHDISSSIPKAPSGDPEFDQYQKVIDEILDKISRQGYSGLTEEEKKILLDASKRIHPDKGYDS